MQKYLKKINLLDHQELIMSSVLALTCLFLSVKFPTDPDSIFQTFTKGLFFLVLVPAIYIKLILKKDLKDFGFNITRKKEGLLWGFLMLILSLAASFAVMKIPGLKNSYHLPSYIHQNFGLFVVYELVLINILLFTYEFFWRGFILFTYSKSFFYWSVPIQAVFFIIFSYFSADISWKYFSLPIFAVTAGITAYKSRSLIFSYAMSLLYMILLDSYLIYLLK